jgi:hypothetical protein
MTTLKNSGFLAEWGFLKPIPLIHGALMSRLFRGMVYPILLAHAFFVTTGFRPAEANRERSDPEKEPKAGEEQEFEIADGVKMKFCWIPPGEGDSWLAEGREGPPRRREGTRVRDEGVLARKVPCNAG